MYRDKRGVIIDLFVTKNRALTLITFKKGSVRGNHKHKKTIQKDFLLWGKLDARFKKNNKITKDFIIPFDLVKICKNISHAYKAMRYSILLSYTYGVRIGRNYEKDTYKLRKKLL